MGQFQFKKDQGGRKQRISSKGRSMEKKSEEDKYSGRGRKGKKNEKNGVEIWIASDDNKIT